MRTAEVRIGPEHVGDDERVPGLFAQSKNIHPHTALRLLTLPLPFRPQPGIAPPHTAATFASWRYCTGPRPARNAGAAGPPARATPATLSDSRP